MNTAFFPLGLAVSLVLAGCQPPATPAAPAASPNAPATALGRMVKGATTKALEELRSKPLELGGGNGREASIAPNGDVTIDGRTLALTPGQRELTLKYRGQVIALATSAAALGSRGADFGLQAASNAIAGVMRGQAEATGREIEAQGRALQAQARTTVCGGLPALKATQAQMTAAVPELAPFGRVDQHDVEDCLRGDHRSASDMSGDGASVAMVRAATAQGEARTAAAEARSDVRTAVQDIRSRVREATPCAFSKPVALNLDTAGVRTVVFELGADDIEATAGAAAPAVQGRICASSKELLDATTVSQERRGDTLLVRNRSADGNSTHVNLSIGPLHIQRYASAQLSATVPVDVTVQVKVGSGQAVIRNALRASADAGSGDVELIGIRRDAYVAVGSGDARIHGAGSATVVRVGSGEADLSGVSGAVQVREVGSGEVKVRDAGTVSIGSVGSGDISLGNIGGSVVIERVGSGDVRVDGVRGELTVRELGSGDVEHSGVTGAVHLPAKR